jgi:hypothetical protein
VLEDKLNERINDSIKALTKQSADRLETKKNMRVLEKQLRNVFDVVAFMLNQNDRGYPIPANVMDEVNKHGMLHSSNVLAEYIMNYNKSLQQN